MTSRPSHDDGDMGRPVHPSDDELSAFINGDTTEQLEIERLQAHLNDCTECRERLADLQAVVSLLNRIDTPAPRRSFTLDPSMVGSIPVPGEPWIIRFQPAMRRVTAIAAVLLLILVVADVLSHQGSVGGSQPSSLSVATTSQTSSAGPAISAAGSSARDSSATTVSGASAFSAPKTAVTGTPVPPESQQQAVAQTHAESAALPGSAASSGPSYWRLIESAVGVVVVWLLFLTVALPRLHLRRKA